MADWVWVESPGTSLDEEPRLRRARFGDGYEQRSPDGINSLAQQWEYFAEDVDDAIAQEMVSFLRTHGVAGFNYVPMWHTAAIRVVCRRWRRTLGSRVGQSNISATFEQVFEP